MKRRNIPILTVFLMLIAGVALAQGPGPGGPGFQAAPPPGGPGSGQGFEARQNILFEFLGLSDEQIEAWTDLVEANRAATQPLHEEMRSLHEELRAALESETPDAVTVGNIMLAIKDLRDEIGEARETLEQNLTALLDNEQLIRFEAFQAAKALLGGPGDGHRRGPGPGPGGNG